MAPRSTTDVSPFPIESTSSSASRELVLVRWRYLALLLCAIALVGYSYYDQIRVNRAGQWNNLVASVLAENDAAINRLQHLSDNWDRYLDATPQHWRRIVAQVDSILVENQDLIKNYPYPTSSASQSFQSRLLSIIESELALVHAFKLEERDLWQMAETGNWDHRQLFKQRVEVILSSRLSLLSELRESQDQLASHFGFQLSN